MKTVILHGYLKDLYPGEIRMNARSVVELVNGICRQTKVFNPTVDRGRHCIRVLGFDTEESLTQPTDQEVIHIVPELSGGKGLLRILAGVALIAVSFLLPGVGPLAVGASGLVSGLFWFGASLVLGGLLQMLSPAPTMDTDAPDNPEASKYLGAPGNTVRIGTRIPILFGRHQAYGHYMSFNIDAKDVTP